MSNHITVKPVTNWNARGRTLNGILVRGAVGGFVVIDHEQLPDVIDRLTRELGNSESSAG